MNSGYNAASLLFNSCMQFRLLEEDSRIGTFQEGQDVEHVWVAWRFRESRRRTGFFIWVKIYLTLHEISDHMLMVTAPRLHHFNRNTNYSALPNTGSELAASKLERLVGGRYPPSMGQFTKRKRRLSFEP